MDIYHTCYPTYLVRIGLTMFRYLTQYTRLVAVCTQKGVISRQYILLQLSKIILDYHPNWHLEKFGLLLQASDPILNTIPIVPHSLKRTKFCVRKLESWAFAKKNTHFRSDLHKLWTGNYRII